MNLLLLLWFLVAASSVPLGRVLVIVDGKSLKEHKNSFVAKWKDSLSSSAPVSKFMGKFTFVRPSILDEAVEANLEDGTASWQSENEGEFEDYSHEADNDVTYVLKKRPEEESHDRSTSPAYLMGHVQEFAFKSSKGPKGPNAPMVSTSEAAKHGRTQSSSKWAIEASDLE
ncbi:CIC11C00000002447 [Sungouiella intermedia]|uniref:CIC11C00000002447 n=1 Tax=Sungouiella intermedia TaxID=45354 RepID=A0A1L0DBE6_9ASCO|nr:CIC11C00000002447 [[Candida] intermedia]